MSLDKAQALNAAKQYVLQRNVQAAVDIYLKLIQDDPSDVTASNTLGDLYATTGQVREAIAQFSRVADTYIQLGHSRQAIATLKKIISIDPANTQTATKLADLYAQAGLPSEARQHYLQIAEALNRKGDTLEALSVFSKVVELDPSNTSTRIKLGELYLREGMNEQAYDAFIAAAGQLAVSGENRRALNAYNEALAIRPDSRDALAATRKLMSLLGIPEETSLPNPSSQRDGSGLANERSSQPTASSSSHTATEPGSDSFVVQEISKAEILVAYGKVNQAISMLRKVLEGRPDNIDVHIKLKDICLRTGMMVEAAHECVALERIYAMRGDSERARDYAVRASRLTQLLEQPSGDLPEPKRKPVEEVERQSSPAPVAAPQQPDIARTPRPVLIRDEARRTEPTATTAPLVSPHPQPVNGTTESAPVQRPAPPTVKAPVVAPNPQTVKAPSTSAVDPRSAPTPISVPIAPANPQPVEVRAAPAAVRPPAPLHERPEKSPAAVETTLAISPAQESALVPLAQASVELPDRELPLLPSLTMVNKRSPFAATGIAAGVFALLCMSAVIGGFAYNSHLDKEYAALSLAVPQAVRPQPPAPQEDEAEQVPQNELTVLATPPAETSDQRQNREQQVVPELTAVAEPAPSQPATGPVRLVTQPAPLPPRAISSPDVRAGTDPRAPAGVSGEVPIGATQPAEPPPSAPRKSPGVVLGSAIKRVDPVYPPTAKTARQSGAVAVEVVISDQGNVISARAVSGPALLMNAAVTAARGWKFKASTLGGVPVQTTTTIVFNFKL